MERSGVHKNRWNGPTERERQQSQRQQRNSRKLGLRNTQVEDYKDLQEERRIGAERSKESLDRERDLQQKVKAIQEQYKGQRKPDALKEEFDVLRRDIEAEKNLRRSWRERQKAIDEMVKQLKDNGLSGARLIGRRPSDREDEATPDLSMLSQDTQATHPQEDEVSAAEPATVNIDNSTPVLFDLLGA